MIADQADPKTEEGQTPKKGSGEILQSEIDEGMDAIKLKPIRLWVSALAAGLEVGFSVMLMAVMLTHAEGKLSEPILKILIANLYSAGFVFVVLGRSELFTEQTTLAVLPVLDGKTSIASLLRLWAIVYVGNILGAAIFARIVTGTLISLGEARASAFVSIAHHMLDHSNGAILMSGVLAGWLMGILSWLVAAGRDTISQVVLVWLVTTSIGFCGLHHAVAGAVELFAGAFCSSEIHAGDLIRALGFATLGNIIGGTVFVAIIKYGHAHVQADENPSGEKGGQTSHG